MSQLHKGHRVGAEPLLPEGGAPVRWYLALVDGEPLLSNATKKPAARAPTYRARTFRTPENALHAARRYVDELVAPRSIAECERCRGHLPLLSPADVSERLLLALHNTELPLTHADCEMCREEREHVADAPVRSRHEHTGDLALAHAALRLTALELAYQLRGICAKCIPT